MKITYLGRYKMVPVYRILSIVDGGIYVARPTSNCALLRALCDNEAAEKFPGHPFIDSMRAAKVDLKKRKDVSGNAALCCSLRQCFHLPCSRGFD